MTRYKTARKIAAVLSGLGWVLLGLSLVFIGIGITLAVMASTGFSPMGLMSPLMPTGLSGLMALVGSALVILAGHVARAVFDIADSAVKGDS